MVAEESHKAQLCYGACEIIPNRYALQALAPTAHPAGITFSFKAHTCVQLLFYGPAMGIVSVEVDVLDLHRVSHTSANLMRAYAITF